jgi:hypothetical protein
VCSVHRGPTPARTEGTTARSLELGLRPLRCAKARRRGRKTERGARGAQLGPHRSSGGAAEAGRRWCRTGRLGEDTAQAWREGKGSGERCGVTRGWCSPFIGAGGALARKCRWVTAGNLWLTPLMAGEGVNGDSRGGIKAGGVRSFEWRRNDGGREARGDQLR